MNKNVHIYSGQLVQFTTGEYSDYGSIGNFVALEDITYDVIQEVRDVVIDEQSKNRELIDAWYDNDDHKARGDFPGHYDLHYNFVGQLVKRGLLATVNIHEFHVGSYDDLDGVNRILNERNYNV